MTISIARPPQGQGSLGTLPVPCSHCGTEVALAAAIYAADDSEHTHPFCCDGCQTVATLLHAQQLDHYYDLRDGNVAPVRTTDAHPEMAWVERYEQIFGHSQELSAIALELQGIQCTACVWLLEAIFRRMTHARTIEINTGLGQVTLLVEPGFALREYVETCSKLGYKLRPLSEQNKSAPSPRSQLIGRLGVCAALALNAMIFALPLYLGLTEGATYQAFRWISFGLSTTSVLVGGTVFFRSAWTAVKQRVLHMDVPIATGIIAAYTGSVYHHFRHLDQSAYFDTVAVFIALMLFGRWLQERAISQNRRMLLSDDGIDQLPIRRVLESSLEVVNYGDVRKDDHLLIATGEPVPVDCTLLSEDAVISLEWIRGESAPKAVHKDTVICAGSFNTGANAIDVRAMTDFSGSYLRTLLQDNARKEDLARTTEWWRKLAEFYVRAVFVIAVGGFAYWLYAANVSKALEVLTAILVITCPCAFGLAAPLAYEIVQSKLRRAGLFLRTAGFLDRATAVRKLVFDKTGTLTTGQLTVRNPDALAALSVPARNALYNLVARSSHPKANAVRRVLEVGSTAPSFDSNAVVREVAGRGIEMDLQSLHYRLGSANWAANSDAVLSMNSEDDLVFSCDDAVLARLDIAEALRPDAIEQVRACREAGYELWILSGDSRARVHAIAAQLGIDAEHALSECSPSAKADWIAKHDHHDTLFVGDGINDAIALSQAHCSGTPTIDRPFVPARSDFYFTTPGLSPICLALSAARALKVTNRRNLTAALAYNLLVIGVALAGGMSPLLCAVIMPVSTLVLLFATWMQLGGSHASWMSSFSKPL